MYSASMVMIIPCPAVGVVSASTSGHAQDDVGGLTPDRPTTTAAPRRRLTYFETRRQRPNLTETWCVLGGGSVATGLRGRLGLRSWLMRHFGGGGCLGHPRPIRTKAEGHRCGLRGQTAAALGGGGRRATPGGSRLGPLPDAPQQWPAGGPIQRRKRARLSGTRLWALHRRSRATRHRNAGRTPGCCRAPCPPMICSSRTSSASASAPSRT